MAEAGTTAGFPATHTRYLTQLAAASRTTDRACLNQTKASHAAAHQFLASSFLSALRNRQLPASGTAPAMAMLAQTLAPGDTYQAYYDPKNGKLQYLNITHADGSKTDWTFDTENQYPWSSAVADYNPAGQTTDATWNNKDGTYIYQVFDLLHGDVPEWITQAGFPDGHWIVWTNDTAGVQQWSQVENVRGAGGVALQEIVSWRNGTTETLTYDTAHGDALETDVATNGAAMSDWVYDTVGNQSWYKYNAFYVNGQLSSQTQYLRDGNTLVMQWDLGHGDALQSEILNTPTGAHQTVWDTAGTQG